VFGYFRRKKEEGLGLVRLRAFPIGEDGEPTWTAEIEEISSDWGSHFRRPFVFQTNGPDHIGGFIARTEYPTDIRTYTARATLVAKNSGLYRTKIFVTAPHRGQLNEYLYEFCLDLQREHIVDIANVLLQRCRLSHTESLQ
jgi:hypothetical protein